MPLKLIGQVVKVARIPNTGINHWVYFPAERMLVGVELQESQQAPPEWPAESSRTGEDSNVLSKDGLIFGLLVIGKQRCPDKGHRRFKGVDLIFQEP